MGCVMIDIQSMTVAELLTKMDPELEGFLPPLDESQRDELKEGISHAGGVTDPITVWERRGQGSGWLPPSEHLQRTPPVEAQERRGLRQDARDRPLLRQGQARTGQGPRGDALPELRPAQLHRRMEALCRRIAVHPPQGRPRRGHEGPQGRSNGSGGRDRHESGRTVQRCAEYANLCDKIATPFTREQRWQLINANLENETLQEMATLETTETVLGAIEDALSNRKLRFQQRAIKRQHTLAARAAEAAEDTSIEVPIIERVETEPTTVEVPIIEREEREEREVEVTRETGEAEDREGPGEVEDPDEEPDKTREPHTQAKKEQRRGDGPRWKNKWKNKWRPAQRTPGKPTWFQSRLKTLEERHWTIGIAFLGRNSTRRRCSASVTWPRSHRPSR